MAATEIYIQAKKERIWVGKLRDMPEGVFEILVQRIANGDAISQLAKYCHKVKPGIAAETYRKWLQALQKVVSAYSAENKATRDSQQEITAFYAAKEKILKKLEPLKIIHEAELVKENVTAILRNMELSDLLKDAWFVQHRRITKLVAIEDKLGYSLPDGPRNIEALATILGLMIKHELATTLLIRKGGGTPMDIDMEKLSPIAQKVAALDDVDRNIIQQLSHKWVEMIQEGIADGAKAEGLGVNEPGTSAAESAGSSRDVGTPIAGST